MYGSLGSIDAAYRTHTGQEPLVQPTAGGPDAQLEDDEPESMPDESWTKAQLVEWVEARGGQVASSATKAEILADIG